MASTEYVIAMDLGIFRHSNKLMTTIWFPLSDQLKVRTIALH